MSDDAPQSIFANCTAGGLDDVGKVLECISTQTEEVGAIHQQRAFVSAL
jgi:hypothetical protein